MKVTKLGADPVRPLWQVLMGRMPWGRDTLSCPIISALRKANKSRTPFKINTNAASWNPDFYLNLRHSAPINTFQLRVVKCFLPRWMEIFHNSDHVKGTVPSRTGDFKYRTVSGPIVWIDLKQCESKCLTTDIGHSKGLWFVLYVPCSWH
jgi:hypothetical protein